MEHHNIKESEQLALLSLSDVTMTEGESKTQNITPIITGKAAGTTKYLFTIAIRNLQELSRSRLNNQK